VRDQTPIHVVGAAIVQGDRCLAAQRGAGMRLAGRWELPGGKVEVGESPERALAREIHEELGVSIQVADWIGRGESRDGGRRIVLDVFAAGCEPTGIRLREHAHVRWLAADELEGLDWADADVPVVPAVRARLRARTAAQRVAGDVAIVSADWSVSPRKRAVCAAVPIAGG